MSSWPVAVSATFMPGTLRASVVRTQFGGARYQAAAPVDVEEHPSGFAIIRDEDCVALRGQLHGAGDVGNKLRAGQCLNRLRHVCSFKLGRPSQDDGRLSRPFSGNKRP